MIRDDDQLDYYSRIPVSIAGIANNIQISNATGFVYQYKDEYYLVTNWHVLSGRDANNKNPLDKKNSALPDRLVINPSIYGRNEVGDFTSRITMSVTLKTDDSYHWYEHPKFKNKIDVALIKIEKNNYAIINADIENVQNHILRIAQDVFILGYPLKNIEMRGFPIWKRGSIATPPMFDIDGLPKYMIDSATRSGMSGAPVFAAFNHVAFKNPDGSFTNTPSLNSLFCTIPHFEFLGVYSGRIGGDDENKIQLGNVWRKNVIEEIISGKKLYDEMEYLVTSYD